uniref:Glycosyl transferase family 2 n=1 Tax=Cyanothece sp. (strain PCC 7425 / ATCC 29141) TaxID=395961 RepID=B8HSA2_CYAP4
MLCDRSSFAHNSHREKPGLSTTTSNVQDPRVVACVATWNGAAFIADTLATLQAQTYPNLHVLISDDASTDETLQICKTFADADPRFQIIQQPQRLGWVGNVNTLLQMAQGDYFFLMPHDDRLAPDYVVRLVEALERQPAAILAFCDLEMIKLNGTQEVKIYTDLEGVQDRVKRVQIWLNRNSRPCIPYRGVFRASAVDRIGGLRLNLAGEFGADWPWLLHLLLLGNFIRVSETLYQRIRRKDSLSHTWNYTIYEWICLALAGGWEIYRSEISPYEKVLLELCVARYCYISLIEESMNTLRVWRNWLKQKRLPW